jgi:hypothetical protein
MVEKGRFWTELSILVSAMFPLLRHELWRFVCVFVVVLVYRVRCRYKDPKTGRLR